MNETFESARAASALMEAISSVFADMAFIDVEPAKSGDQGGIVAVAKPIRVAIDVLKPASCRIEIECSVALKDKVESTLFEGDGDAKSGSEEDSLLEILNVAAGVFLTAYFGAGADIKLELPQYLFFTDGPEGEILAEAQGDAEGDPIRAVLRSIRYHY